MPVQYPNDTIHYNAITIQKQYNNNTITITITKQQYNSNTITIPLQ